MKGYIRLICIFALFLTALPLIALLGRRPAEPAAAAPEDEVRLLLGGEAAAVSMREYIIGAAAAQMPADLELEALKAQAVLAHTYALRRQLEESISPTEGLKGALIGDDTSVYQAYFDEGKRRELYGSSYGEYSEKLSLAADYALTRSLVFEGEPIIAAFHPISSGRTESAKDAWGESIPYLVSVQSEQDTELPLCRTELTLSREELFSMLSEAFPNLSLDRESLTAKVTERTEGGAAGTVALCGSSFVSGRSFAEAVSLPSAHFDISEQEGSFTLVCLGRGHLVGMSQLGADAMASSGSSCEEILAHYFPNARLENSEGVR
ncbi:MAG: SpoIID/LytB domain-containing protein [Ruminococcus sp.]|nr:SpoIID/LytB domain-containing protein [Ruminococcus sp.]